MAAPYGSPTPQVRFDVITQAFALFQQQMGQWVVLTLVYLLIMGVATVLLGLIPIVGGILSAIPALTLMGGLYRAALKHIRGDAVQVSDLFDIGDIIGPLIVAGILTGIATSIGALLCVLPMFVVGGLLMFAVPMVADRGVDGVEALKASWNALKSQWLMAAVFYFVASLVGAVGALLCGVGLLFTLPIMILAIALLYRDFFPEDVAEDVPPATF